MLCTRYGPVGTRFLIPGTQFSDVRDPIFAGARDPIFAGARDPIFAGARDPIFNSRDPKTS